MTLATMKAKTVWSSVSSILLFLTLIAILLILIAGSNPHVLSDLFFFKADTKSLNIPSALSSSTFLKDLSTITGTDLVGSSVTASSLGLADSYTISLFTSCSHNSTSSCTSPKLGFSFSPIKELNLPSTISFGNVSYRSTSFFLGLAYIFSFVLDFLSLILVACGERWARALTAAIVTSGVSTIWLMAASIRGLAKFSSYEDAFNAALSSVGVKSSLGKIYVLSFLATALSLLATIAVFVRTRMREKRSRRTPRITVNSKSIDGEGFLNKIPTWKRHKYSQIQKQAAPAVNEDEDTLLRRGFGGDVGEEELGHELDIGRGPRRGVIPLKLLKSKEKDVGSGYEPYRREE